MVNEVFLVGNLGRDPVVRSTSGGQAVASRRIATSRSWTDKQSGQDRCKVKALAETVRFLGGGQRGASPRAVPDEVGGLPLGHDIHAPAISSPEEVLGGDVGCVGPSGEDVWL